MQRELPESLIQIQQRTTSPTSQSPYQYGFQHHARPNGSAHHLLQEERTRSMSPRSVPGDDGTAQSGDGVSLHFLDERLRGLNVEGQPSAGHPKPLGHRISEYENALTPPMPKQALGFKVTKRADAGSDRVNLTDFPNEILTHILSHLHPDSHASVALVSKRFYALVTTPHAWRMAFQRFFPGQDALSALTKSQGAAWDQEDSDVVRSEVRYFTRLTSLASWRSEYLLRTRLLRSLSRGKPGSNAGDIGSSSRTGHSSKKASAVLTYNTKLPSIVTHVHASFKPGGKKPPRVVHGAADVGIVSASDPAIGKVEKWGLDDPLSFAQLDEVMPQILPYGVGEGPAAVPNVMDVSQPYGVVGGQGFPGGRVFFRPTGEFRGKFLGEEAGLIEAHPDIPKIPELSEAICSVWIAKSSSILSMTQWMVGIMTGSSLGVITTYALGYDPSGPRYKPGEISARWVISPGVPIIAIKVDDNYTQKKKALNRVWAVALNALGEVYYLKQPPAGPASKSKSEDSTKYAWHAGRSTYWHLVEATRRQARLDESGKNAVRGAYSPRSPSNDMDLQREQVIAEAREIEKFLRYKPAHFRKVCNGWDMRRKLEVDFASDDGQCAGESIFVVNCALEEDQVPSLRRYRRSVTNPAQGGTTQASPLDVPAGVAPTSIFGGGGFSSHSPESSDSPSLKQLQDTPTDKLLSPPTPNNIKSGVDDWSETAFLLKDLGSIEITTSSIDMSLIALMASFEDPLMVSTSSISDSSNPATPNGQAPSDIPGRRARLLGLGTNTGKILLWNMRQAHTDDGVHPVRIIQTESPEISSLALSALYLVHGGSDGLVQAWDPLASTLDPIRTLNSRSPGRMPRHLLTINPALRDSNFSAVGAIYLDPDPAVLHGIVAFGTFVRYWAYSSSSQATGRKRRLRHSEVHGRGNSRRYGGGVKGYIAAEAEELRNEQEHMAREQARLRSRFGVGLGDLTEEEALRYAEMISREAFTRDEQQRTSASDTGSAADFDTTSTGETVDTVTPEPSLSSTSLPGPSTRAPVDAAQEDDYERQIQAAIRLSLLESGNDAENSPMGVSSGEYGEYDAPFTLKEKKGKRHSPSSPSSSHTPMVRQHGSSSAVATVPVADDDLELALKLSLEEEQARQAELAAYRDSEQDEFPPLQGEGTGKGKGRAF
ncbi:hypothetical protein F4775DRAFT_556421 [Biscogniauxia sp. FL1348]|nr:hypothetical protein F4775DRAFT_556421 [Biscogniauxia sp. FL1348]